MPTASQCPVMPELSAFLHGLVDAADRSAAVHTGFDTGSADLASSLGVAVNDQTRTVYVTNNTLGDTPGTVSVINGAACDGSRVSGCAGRMPTAPVGRSPGVIVVDTRTDIIYVADENSAAVSVINGSQCRAGMTRGCRRTVTTQAVGSIPIGISVNQRTRTVYVTQVFQAGSMSVFRSRP
jgi:hypothetical protein